MRLPQLPYSDRISKEQKVRFAGLNHNLGAGDGELWDMKNLTGDHYPLLAVRSPRFAHSKLSSPGGIFAREKLCWVAEGKFYWDGQEKGNGLSPGMKHFTAIGSYIVIFPDKCYYNTADDSFGNMQAHWTGQQLTFCDGILYEKEASANCIRAEGADWAEQFRAGDAVTISGCTQCPENNVTIIIRAVDGECLYFYEDSFRLPEGTDSCTEEGILTIDRTVPDLLYVCEQDNRLWGCTQDTIYASKPGDIFNWNVYDGLDSDAWAITPSSPGPFTGCVSYGNYPIFFKEDRIYKIYGSVPSAFSCVESASTGLVAGSEESLAVAAETLFWLGRNGVVAYTGGIPQQIGDAFGRKRFRWAVAVSDGLKYFVSMCDEENRWGLYVYDTRLDQWYKEDDIRVTHAVRLNRCVYLLEESGQIWITGAPEDMPPDVTREDGIPWMMETTDFTEGSPNKKHAGKVQLRLELEEGATAQVWMQFDSDGIWHRVSNPLGQAEKRSYYLPVKPRRCDHYRMKITGTGGCRIHSITRDVAPGSEHDRKNGRY